MCSIFFIFHYYFCLTPVWGSARHFYDVIHTKAFKLRCLLAEIPQMNNDRSASCDGTLPASRTALQILIDGRTLFSPQCWWGSRCHGNVPWPVCSVFQTVSVRTLLPVLLPAVGAAQSRGHALQRPALQVRLLRARVRRRHHPQQPHPHTHRGEAFQVSNSEYLRFLDLLLLCVIITKRVCRSTLVSSSDKSSV